MADLSPAAELRQAAKLMRERAEAATPGEWHAFSSAHEEWYVASKTYGQVTTGIHDEPASTEIVLIERDRADAEHIAGWSRDPALAVADLLEAASTCECAESTPEGADTRVVRSDWPASASFASACTSAARA